MARIVFTTQPASGHLRPLVPIARAARVRGHEVAVLAPRPQAAEIAAYGLPHLVGGYDWRAEVANWLPANLRELDFLAAAEVFRVLGRRMSKGFAGHMGQATCADLLAIAEDWRPDLVIRELDELGGYLAAEVLGIPHVSIASFGGVEAMAGAEIAVRLDEGRARFGLPPDPSGARLYHYLHANFLPPQYSAAEMILPNTRCYRHPNAGFQSDRLPDWLAELDSTQPFVFAGFGTVVYGLPGADTFVRTVIEALGRVDCTAVLAVGAGGSTDAYGELPPNVRLVDFVDQPLMLEGADLFVTHGGLNSMKEAMRLGVPMVNIPVLDDHRHNAAQAEATGTTAVVPLEQFSADTVAQACARTLTDPNFRRSARRLQRRIHALPGVDVLLDDLEALL
ncbi:glycosyltransferase [Nocardia brasiliensis]|uniref:glycosyltransferase n=1 Tax=Nocardia brasiliensis TaxID=37326 RepID=UPI00366F6FDB